MHPRAASFHNEKDPLRARIFKTTKPINHAPFVFGGLVDDGKGRWAHAALMSWTDRSIEKEACMPPPGASKEITIMVGRTTRLTPLLCEMSMLKACDWLEASQPYGAARPGWSPHAPNAPPHLALQGPSGHAQELAVFVAVLP
jgi:hypothetical protein